MEDEMVVDDPRTLIDEAAMVGGTLSLQIVAALVGKGLLTDAEAYEVIMDAANRLDAVAPKTPSKAWTDAARYLRYQAETFRKPPSGDRFQ